LWNTGSSDITLSVATGHTARESFNLWEGKQISSFPKHSDWLWGPLSLLFNGWKGTPAPEVKRLVHEADHLPPSSARLQNKWR
jgi:hypothetical protein